MITNNSPTSASNAKAGQSHVAVQLFEQISFLALNVRGLNMLPEDDDIHINAALMASIASMVAQIGWLADMGAESLGGMASLSSDPTEWMLSRSYHDAKAIEQQAGSEVDHV